MIKLFQFTKDVFIDGPSGCTEFLANLAEITAPPFSFEAKERRKPLRGKLTQGGGVIRWPLGEYRRTSTRKLHFNVRETANGTELRGQFQLYPAYKVIVLGWLGLGSLWWLSSILYVGLSYHRWGPIVGQGVTSLIVCSLMAYGYTWFCTCFGSRRERDLENVLRNMLLGTREAKVVKDLLTR